MSRMYTPLLVAMDYYRKGLMCLQETDFNK